ncbi:hypothetical protein [Ktedonobacter racemifer]|uniref:hypothetical protein n=1 Tax=Ktedonobacter racemifer TaxID=363277 RepID=UPI0005908C4B|nr:hypothetical protein [Ktedonobacter racemifer]
MRLDSHAPQKAAQRRGKIAPAAAPDPSRIMVKGHHGRAAVGEEGVDDGLQCGFGVKVRMDLSIEPDRGASIHGIADLHHMLLLAAGFAWIGTHGGSVLEVDLHLLQWPGARQEMDAIIQALLQHKHSQCASI